MSKKFYLNGDKEGPQLSISFGGIENYCYRIRIDAFTFGNHLHIFLSPKFAKDETTKKWIKKNYKHLKCESNVWDRVIVKTEE